MTLTLPFRRHPPGIRPLTSSVPPPADPARAVPSDRLWLRSELMGTQVITRDTGRRLGVVGEVVVDIDRREVMALGLRDNPFTRFLPGLPRWMPLDRIRQVGDVILVDSVDSLTQNFNPERYSKVINCQVVSEAGEQLGRVLGFSFDIETGELTTLVLGALGVPLLGEGVLSTWELAVEEIVSSGPDRIIVYEGAEDKLKQLGSGLLEKLGIGGPSWEQEERDRYRQSMVPVENQLASGQATPQEQRRIQPATNRAFAPRQEDELEYVELERRREEPLRQRRYLDEEERGEPSWSAREPERPEAPGGWDRRPSPSRGADSGRSYDPEDGDPDGRDSADRDPSDRYADDRYVDDRGRVDPAGFDRDPRSIDARPVNPRLDDRRDVPAPGRREPMTRPVPRRVPLDRPELLDVDPEPYGEPSNPPPEAGRGERAASPGFEDPW